jgi:putative PIN family toxin of toxin-antitoxin system
VKRRLVLDTDVFIAALAGPGGSARSVLRACLAGEARPLIGEALFCEYESVLDRPALWRRSRLDSAERRALLEDFLSVAEWVEVYFGWRPNLPDESDNHLFELAVAGAAGAIVTRNVRDLRRGELRFPGLRVLTPQEWLKEDV